MRSRISMSLTAILLLAVVAPLLLAADTSFNRDRLWAHFDKNVKFADRLLPAGDYLIVHDDALKAAGEPCLYVFNDSKADEPMVAVHCVRKVRDEMDRDQVAWRQMTQGTRDVEFVQFAGDDYAHYLQ